MSTDLPVVLIACDRNWALDAVAHHFARRFASLPPVHSVPFLGGVLALLHVDVVLLGFELAGEFVPTILPALKNEYPTTRFLLFSSDNSLGPPHIAGRCCADGFVHGSASLAQLDSAIDHALVGDVPWMPHQAIATEIGCSRPKVKAGDWAATRDKVSWLLEANFSHKECANTLQISEKDVQYHVHEIRRLGLIR